MLLCNFLTFFSSHFSSLPFWCATHFSLLCNSGSLSCLSVSADSDLSILVLQVLWLDTRAPHTAFFLSYFNVCVYEFVIVILVIHRRRLGHDTATRSTRLTLRILHAFIARTCARATVHGGIKRTFLKQEQDSGTAWQLTHLHDDFWGLRKCDGKGGRKRKGQEHGRLLRCALA